MMDDLDFDKYNKEIIDVDEIKGTDVKINPDYYIHHALLKAQSALIKDNVKEGFVQFRVIVEHIEVLCKAANMLSADYSTNLEEYLKTEQGKKDEFRSVKIANKKIELLMNEVFNNKVTTDPLKG